ncbi:hypothetical protein ACFLW1_02195 [Chloroflexota bacterium]
MSGSYEVLSPWADVAPVVVRGISPRLADLGGKTIGLFVSARKASSEPILNVLEARLAEKYPTARFSRYMCRHSVKVTETEDAAAFADWVKGVDAAIAAVGD